MRLTEKTLENLAKMVVGDSGPFRYRRSGEITDFFRNLGFNFVHDGSTRWRWAQDRLRELNNEGSDSIDLPSKGLIRIIRGLLDIDEFEEEESRQLAVVNLNRWLKRYAVEAVFHQVGSCFLRNVGTGVASTDLHQDDRPLTPEEKIQRNRLIQFLDESAEDEFTEGVVVPLFQSFGFKRVIPAGHKEKTLEFGKDLWMKFQLPTRHWLYFGAQVKRDKLDATAGARNTNIATVLSQVRMALDHPIFDPDVGRKVLIDHIFVISAGEITRAAKTWIVENLDNSQRRSIIFMDREEFLDHAGRLMARDGWTENEFGDRSFEMF